MSRQEYSLQFKPVRTQPISILPSPAQHLFNIHLACCSHLSHPVYVKCDFQRDICEGFAFVSRSRDNDGFLVPQWGELSIFQWFEVLAALHCSVSSPSPHTGQICIRGKGLKVGVVMILCSKSTTLGYFWSYLTGEYEFLCVKFSSTYLDNCKMITPAIIFGWTQYTSYRQLPSWQ